MPRNWLYRNLCALLYVTSRPEHIQFIFCKSFLVSLYHSKNSLNQNININELYLNILSNTRIKVNMNEGTVELEGTEFFVEKHWEEIKSFMNEPTKLKPIADRKRGKLSKKKLSSSGKDRKPRLSTPIPINLKGGKNTPSLKKFFETKKPIGNQNIITVFAYYLNKYCNIPHMEIGHAISCYNEIGFLRKPTNIYAVGVNVRTRKGYLDNGDTPHSFKITIQGENLIEHDLPPKPKAKK